MHFPRFGKSVRHCVQLAAFGVSAGASLAGPVHPFGQIFPPGAVVKTRHSIWFEANDQPNPAKKNLADIAAEDFATVTETHYQHRTHVDRNLGIYDVDCSGLVDFLLKRFAPDRFAELPVEPGHARPRAAMYYEFFTGLNKSPVPGWSAVNQLAQARRGDIIAWKLAASQEGDTGHVAIVSSTPKQRPSGLYAVEVYDSSGILHDEDSRLPGTTGFGHGIIFFQVDFQGVPVAFQFNQNAHIHEEAIAIGRVSR